MNPPGKHERYFFTERQLAILDSSAPDYRFYRNNESYSEWLRFHTGGVLEIYAVIVHRTDPPNILETICLPGGTFTREELKAAARRYEEWWIYDLRQWGIPLLGWQDEDRTDQWFYKIRFVDRDIETTNVIEWIERDLRRAGATEPTEWIAEVCSEL